MRFSTSTFLLPLLPFIQAHTIFQRVSVNGADQGQRSYFRSFPSFPTPSHPILLPLYSYPYVTSPKPNLLSQIQLSISTNTPSLTVVGVRAPSTNNPVQDVTSSAITCNTGLLSPVSTKVISIPAGAKVGTWWQHVIGGPQGASDPDNPIASSHKGPLIVYLAKVCLLIPHSGTRFRW